MFKVGDRVIYSGKGGFSCQLDGSVGVVKGYRTSETSAVEFDLHGEYLCQNINLSLTPDGPVRTVTRREIVPGTYGRVKVTKGLYVHCNSMSTAEELREAAHILNQLAEALEDKP